MSLHNQHTEQKVRVQTAWGEGGGPLRPPSLWSSSLGTQQVLNMGSCGPTVHVSSSRKEAGGGVRGVAGIRPSPAGGGGEEPPGTQVSLAL